jgi:hypothetical protein
MPPMTLVAALLALFSGPLLERLGYLERRTLAFVDGFVFVTVAGVILIGLLPDSAATLGPGALALAAAGFLLLAGLEAVVVRTARGAHAAVLLLAVLGLVLHQALDGIALGTDLRGSGAGHAHADSLGTAIVLHSVPLGIAVWFLSVPAFGRRLALALLVLLATATAGGYLGGPRLLGLLDSPALDAFQAFLAGSILHIVAHGGTALRSATARTPADANEPPGSATVSQSERLGTLAGLALLAAWW